MVRWNSYQDGQDQGGIKYSTTWEPILSAEHWPKQRESDATEGVQNCGNLGIKIVV